MKFAVPKLVNAITRDLFLEDIDHHFDSMISYKLPEFLLPGEETELAPATTIFLAKKWGHSYKLRNYIAFYGKILKNIAKIV